MVELFKIRSNGQIQEIKKDTIAYEPKAIEEIRNFIIANEKILGNITLLDNKIETSAGTYRHMLGVDMTDLRPVIVELRNMDTGIDAISQILPYCDFIKSNPDTLKFRISSNLKFMQKLEGLKIDLNKLSEGVEGDPKVILVAPTFKKELLDVVDLIKFEIKLIEMSRYKSEDGEIVIVVNQPQIPIPSGKFRLIGTWDYPSIEQRQKEIEIPQEETIESEIPQEIPQSIPISSRVLNYLFKE